MCLQWRIWKAVTGGNKGAAVTEVEFKEDGNVRKADSRVEVEKEIMKCLTKRFSLTNHCTSMSQFFVTEVGYLAEKSGAERILQGNIPMEWKANKDLELFLSLIKYPEIRE